MCNYHKKDTYWLCACKCGNLKEVKLSDLISGHTMSCGCLQREVSKRVKHKHGKRYTRIYSILASMKQRCYNKNNKRYKNYGGWDIEKALQ